MIDRIPREPCQICGAALYYAEQWQSLCRSCAAGLGITRLCDNPRERVAPDLTPQQRAWLDGEPYADVGPNCRCHVGDLQFDESTLDIIRAEITSLIERDPTE